MEDLDLLREGAQETLGMLRRAAAQSRLEIDRARRRFAALKRGRDAVTAALERVRRRHRATAFLLFVPVVGWWARGRLDARSARLERDAAARASKMAEVRRSAVRHHGFLRRCVGIGRKVVKAREAMDHLGVLPEELRDEAAAAANRALLLRRTRRSGKGPRAVEAGEGIVRVVLAWAKAKAIAEERAKRERRRTDSARTSSVSQRVYLPIPVGMRHAAQRAGATYDPDAPAGSRMFATLDQNLEPLQRMLPLAYRDRPTQFDFPPIRHNAAGQNLWSIFDRGTWDHIRTAAYERAGRRCMVCGRQRGFILDKVFPEQERRRGPVDCHEVWEWETPDLKDGVGIQRLKHILVVCVDCHMMFHEGFTLQKAREAGLEDQVKDFLDKRRMLVNRMDAGELKALIERNREDWARTDGVTRWVMDLSHLGAQDYMTHHEPVFVTENRAGLRPEDVAGIDFVTDGGERFRARNAMDIYNELAGKESRRAYLP